MGKREEEQIRSMFLRLLEAAKESIKEEERIKFNKKALEIAEEFNTLCKS